MHQVTYNNNWRKPCHGNMDFGSIIYILPGNSEVTDAEIELIGRIPTKNAPLTSTEKIVVGRFRYDELRQMFYDNNWSMRELLEYYNNLDVKPFLDALENLTQYYIARGEDIFKSAISS